MLSDDLPTFPVPREGNSPFDAATHSSLHPPLMYSHNTVFLANVGIWGFLDVTTTGNILTSRPLFSGGDVSYAYISKI